MEKDNGPEIDISKGAGLYAAPKENAPFNAYMARVTKAAKENRIEEYYQNEKSKLEKMLKSWVGDNYKEIISLLGNISALEDAYRIVKKGGNNKNIVNICPKCGIEYENSAKFCGKCGTGLVLMQCACGEIFRKKGDGSFDKFCMKCGQMNPFEQAKQALAEEVRKKAEEQRIAEEKSQKQENERQHREYIKNLKEGDTIKFGSYPFEAEGTEKPIEWRILEKNEDGTAIIMSSNGIDAKPYNMEKKDITWAECSLRRWLNDEFYSKAFTAKEKDAIVEVSLENKDNIGEITQELVDLYKKIGIDLSTYKGLKWHTRGGEYTKDKVWLLSLEDMKRYDRIFSMDSSSIAMPTPYAKERGAYSHADSGGSCWWWLRSPGGDQDRAANVIPASFVYSIGNNVNTDDDAVRMAFKINLNNL